MALDKGSMSKALSTKEKYITNAVKYLATRLCHEAGHFYVNPIIKESPNTMEYEVWVENEKVGSISAPEVYAYAEKLQQEAEYWKPDFAAVQAAQAAKEAEYYAYKAQKYAQMGQWGASLYADATQSKPKAPAKEYKSIRDLYILEPKCKRKAKTECPDFGYQSTPMYVTSSNIFEQYKELLEPVKAENVGYSTTDDGLGVTGTITYTLNPTYLFIDESEPVLLSSAPPEPEHKQDQLKDSMTFWQNMTKFMKK